MITMTKVIQTFHDNIKSGPEYVCTFSDQLWYRSSVRKCEANKYRKYSATLLVTTTAIIDNAKRFALPANQTYVIGSYQSVLQQTKWDSL